MVLVASLVMKIDSESLSKRISGFMVRFPISTFPVRVKEKLPIAKVVKKYCVSADSF